MPKAWLMHGPLLAIQHPWHQQRRSKGTRPPPLVAAGLDLEWDAEHGGRATSAAMAIIFGMFPNSLSELVNLARHRLHVNAGQAQPLAQVLGSRMLAIWAWLPTLQADAYVEFDHATGTGQAWLLVGDGPQPMDIEQPPESVAMAFPDAVILHGNQVWGGENGLERLQQRFGPRPLFVAARMALALERQPKNPGLALAVAHDVWPDLTSQDPEPWTKLAGTQHPFLALQLGRLALRMGLMTAARDLFAAIPPAQAEPIMFFDLGQAHEGLGDSQAAAQAFARFSAAVPADPDGWRRQLLARIRLGEWDVVDNLLARYRQVRGNDTALIQRVGVVLGQTNAPGMERARLVGWCAQHVGKALTSHFPVVNLLAQWSKGRSPAARLGMESVLYAGPSAENEQCAALLALPHVFSPTDQASKPEEWATWIGEAVRLAKSTPTAKSANEHPPTVDPAWCLALAGAFLLR